jgi:putative oxidoreductase
MNLALLTIRLVVGLLMAGHGAQKLFGSFGGSGLESTGAVFEKLGLRPGRALALGAGAAELGGGILLAAGLVTPVAAAVVTAVMLVAIWTVHLPKGVWVTDSGYEYNLVLIAASFMLAGAGPGAWSLDHAFGIELAGSGWALASLGAGLLGAVLTVGVGRVIGLVGHRGHGPTPARG